MKYNVEARGLRLINISADGGQWVTETIEANSHDMAKSKATRRFGKTADVIKVHSLMPIGKLGYAGCCIGTKRRVIPQDGLKWGVNFAPWKIEDINEEERLDAELEARIEKYRSDFKSA